MTEKKLLRRFVLLGMFAIWITFNIILLLRHELWRDEANVWLIARSLTPRQLFMEIKYQGHPCLWYLLVMPFAKAGLPFITIGIMSLMIMSVSAGIFLWKAPIHIFTKIVCLFSPIFTYYYPVIARNYCLIALLFILLAWCYPKRNEKPVMYGVLLGLLVQADTIALAGAGLISAMWLWEGAVDSLRTHSKALIGKVARGIWIPLASLILWIAEFRQVSTSPHYQMRDLGLQELIQEIKNYSYTILMRISGQERTFCTVAFLLLLIVGLVISIKVRNFWTLAVMIGSFLLQSLFSVLVYQLHIWHFISLCFVYLWMLWVWDLQAKDKTTKKLLYLPQIWLGILAICMFLCWNSEEETSSLDNALHGSYSDGVHAAAYIKQEISNEDILIITDVPFASSVMAYLKNYDFYYAGTGQKVYYADYSEEQEKRIAVDDLLIWAQEAFPNKSVIYLLDSYDSCIDHAEKLQEYEVLYHTNEKTARGEDYSIYRIPIS